MSEKYDPMKLPAPGDHKPRCPACGAIRFRREPYVNEEEPGLVCMFIVCDTGNHVMGVDHQLDLLSLERQLTKIGAAKAKPARKRSAR